MSLRVGVLAVTLSACANEYAGDGVTLSGPQGSGGLIRGRFFEHTNCAANASGDVRCFSSCNPIVYGMGDDLSTVDRIGVPTVACNGALDEAGNVAIVAEVGIVAMHADGSFTTISEVPQQLVSRGGRIALIGATGGLAAYDADSGQRLWSNDLQAFAGVALQSDGTVIAAGDTSLVAFAPDGTVRWSQGPSSAVAVGPHDEIATIGGGRYDWQLELREKTGDLRWGRTVSIWMPPRIELATDGGDIYVAASGATETIAGGLPGSVTREAMDGSVWSTSVAGWAPDEHILALTEDALFVQASVVVGSIDQDQFVADDHAVTGVGSSVLETEGAGNLIAKIGR